MSLSWFFFPSPFNQCPFIFIFIHLLSVSCCIHSSAWWVSYLVENEQFVPWRFQLFGSLRDSSLEYQWGEWKVKSGKKRKCWGFFPNKVLFQGKGLLEISSLTTGNKQEQKVVERGLQFHTFASLSGQIYCSSNFARYAWREKNNIERRSCFSSTLNKWLCSFRRIWEPAMSLFIVLVIFWWGT